jgi:competence protein ComGC
MEREPSPRSSPCDFQGTEPRLRPICLHRLTWNCGEPQRGLSLVEMSLVLMVMALMLVGIVKGQELVQNSRVHSTIAGQNGFKGAVLAFQDRYRQFPGDYAEAVTNVPHVQHNGNGDGRIEALAGVAGPNGVPEENVLAWDHLAKAGFVRGDFIFNATIPDGAIPKNAFGGFVDLTFDSVYGNPGQSGPPRHTLKTGNQMPVEILAEMDRKIDDGNAFSGEFRFSAFARTGSVPDASGGAGACSATDGRWITNTAALAVNCGAAVLL